MPLEAGHTTKGMDTTFAAASVRTNIGPEALCAVAVSRRPKRISGASGAVD